MAIVFDATTGTTLVQTGASSGTNDTTTITVGASATIFIAALEASVQGGDADSTITITVFTLGGQALTAVTGAIDHSGGLTAGYCQLWYLLNPPTGSACAPCVHDRHPVRPAIAG